MPTDDPFWIVESASDAAGPKHLSAAAAVVKDGATEPAAPDPAWRWTFGGAGGSAGSRTFGNGRDFPDSDIQDRIYMLCDLTATAVQVYDRAAKSLDLSGPRLLYGNRAGALILR